MALTFLAATAFLAFWTAQIDRFEIMTDEMLYQRMALGFLETLSPSPHVHDQSVAYPSLTYPMLIAPTQLLGLEDGFRAAHLLNAALMASVCIPVYLLARSAGASRPVAWLSATISAIVPWTVFSAMLLTEVAAYPVFAWAMLAIHRCIVSPGPRSDSVALLAIAIAFFTRTQFALLVAVLPAALLTHELTWAASTAAGAAGNRRRAMAARLHALVREHAFLVGAGGIGLLALIFLQVTGGVTRIFGSYEGIASGPILVEGIDLHMRALLSVLALELGILPLIGWAAWALASITRPVHKGAHALAMLSILTVATVLVVVASFDLRTYGLVQDRYAFYVAPLLIIGLLMLLERRAHATALLAAGAFSVWVMLAYSDAQPRYTWIGAFHTVYVDVTDAVGNLIQRPGLTVNQLAVALTAAATVLLLAVCLKTRRRLPVFIVGALLLVYGTWHSAYILDEFAAGHSSRAGDQDWIDRAVGEKATVALLPALVADPPKSFETWWSAEFWNRSVRRQWLHKGTSFRPTPFPSHDLTVDKTSGRIEVEDPVPHVVLPLHDKRFGIEGRPVARNSELSLIKAALPLRATWTIEGTNTDGWSAPKQPVRVRVFAPGRAIGPVRARVKIDVLSDPSLTRRTYTIRGGTRVVKGAVPPGASSRPSVSVCVPPRSHRDIVVHVPQAGLLGTSPSMVGLAFTGVHTRFGGACSPTSAA
jgi:hypothetical protein